MSHAPRGGQASDQANARRPGRCRQRERTSPIEGTREGPISFLGHALATDSSLGLRFAEPVDPRLTISARGTSSHQSSMVDLTDWQAHDLTLGIDISCARRVLTYQRLGTSLIRTAIEVVDPH